MTNERQVAPGSYLPALRRGAWDLHFDDDILLQQLQVYLLAHGHPSCSLMEKAKWSRGRSVLACTGQPGMWVWLYQRGDREFLAYLAYPVPLLKAHTFSPGTNDNRESWDPLPILCIINNNVLSERKNIKHMSDKHEKVSSIYLSV